MQKRIKGIIYCYEFPNGNCYIGQTIHPERRKYTHRKDAENGSNLPFHKAIREFGWDNIKYHVLEEISDVSKSIVTKQLNVLEIKYIEQYKLGGKILYNATNGGEGTSGRTLTQEQKESVKQRMLDYYKTDDGKENLRKRSKIILQYDLDGNFVKEWPSLGSVKFVSDSSLCDYLAGRKHTVGNSLWILKEDVSDINLAGKKLYEKFISETQNRRVIQKPILQIDKSTLKIVKKFESPKLAIETTKIHHIQSCLNGSRKTAGGFIWVYEDKYKNKNYD